jgi:hypothetical protein
MVFFIGACKPGRMVPAVNSILAAQYRRDDLIKR